MIPPNANFILNWPTYTDHVLPQKRGPIQIYREEGKPMSVLKGTTQSVAIPLTVRLSGSLPS